MKLIYHKEVHLVRLIIYLNQSSNKKDKQVPFFAVAFREQVCYWTDLIKGIELCAILCGGQITLLTHIAQCYNFGEVSEIKRNHNGFP